jgi:hypothetical protein
VNWQSAVVAASSGGDVSYNLGYLVGRLFCCFVVIAGIATAIVMAVRSIRARSAARNFGQMPYQQPPYGYQPPPGYQQPPPGYQQPPGGYQQPPPGYQPPPGTYPPYGQNPPPPPSDPPPPPQP